MPAPFWLDQVGRFIQRTLGMGNAHLTQQQRTWNAHAIYAAFRATGLSHIKTCYGPLASADGESSLNPAAAGDHRDGKATAFSLWQWHGDRADAIQKGIGIDVRDPDITCADACKAVLWELQHGGEHRAWAALLNAPDDPREACRIFIADFERSASQDSDLVKRMNYGANWAAHFDLVKNNDWTPKPVEVAKDDGFATKDKDGRTIHRA